MNIYLSQSNFARMGLIVAIEQLKRSRMEH